MSTNEKPLPRPKKTAFGKSRRFEDEDEGLLADELAMAASQGRLDEFMQSRMPDNEHARNLTMMMMGMTGMLPADDAKPLTETGEGESANNPVMSQTNAGSASTEMETPEDLVKAAHAGDVGLLMGMLEREHKKRNPDAAEAAPETKTDAVQQPCIEKEVIDRLIKIASDNSLTLDWLVLRALKIYVDEYSKTGRL